MPSWSQVLSLYLNSTLAQKKSTLTLTWSMTSCAIHVSYQITHCFTYYRFTQSFGPNVSSLAPSHIFWFWILVKMNSYIYLLETLVRAGPLHVWKKNNFTRSLHVYIWIPKKDLFSHSKWWGLKILRCLVLIKVPR
jgi:hypothetical protein